MTAARLTGQRFGALLVVRDLRPDGSGKTGAVWVRCEGCGDERHAQVARLLRGALGCRKCSQSIGRLPVAERQAALRARRLEEAKCRRCGKPAAGRHCEECLAQERARYQARRPLPVRSSKCRACGEGGHNRRTCPAARPVPPALLELG